MEDACGVRQVLGEEICEYDERVDSALSHPALSSTNVGDAQPPLQRQLSERIDERLVQRELDRMRRASAGDQETIARFSDELAMSRLKLAESESFVKELESQLSDADVVRPNPDPDVDRALPSPITNRNAQL